MGQGKAGNRGSKAHPSRISGHQKMLRAKEANERAEKARKAKERPMIPVDMKKQDWSR